MCFSCFISKNKENNNENRIKCVSLVLNLCLVTTGSRKDCTTTIYRNERLGGKNTTYSIYGGAQALIREGEKWMKDTASS
ncbi:hypothetical protein ACSBR2_014023 [Camellia fascicularis]